MASRFRSLASVLRALASTSLVPVVAKAPRGDDEASLDTERVLEILRRGQRGERARSDRDAPARSLSPAATGLEGPGSTGAPAASGEGDAPASVTGRRET